MKRLVLAVALLLAVAAPAQAATSPYAPVDRPGPALSVPQAALDASLVCKGDLANGPHEPVLFVPGTEVDPQEFTWNWFKSLDALGWSYCSVTLPFHTTGDAQVAAEYVVNAVRTMHTRSNRKIQVVGHSQGGMLPRWAIRFWPDIRPMIDDVAGMAPSNHGTVVAAPTCTPDCQPAVWQQRDTAAFIAALNTDGETFAGISYTNAYTHTDEVVVPNADAATGSSSLRTGAGQIANIALQDVCPADVTEHLGIGTYDNTAYAIVMDALTHDGPAVASRIPAATCTSPLQPGVNPATYATDYANTLALLGQNDATAPHSAAEPALACYTQRVCAQAGPASAAVTSQPAGQAAPALAVTGGVPLAAGALAVLGAAGWVARRRSSRPWPARL